MEHIQLWLETSFPDTIEFLQTYLAWIMNATSMIGAWCLSNRRAQLGRKIGMCSATMFMVYGLVANQPAFIVADAIFLWIYTSAFWKFREKRDFYRQKAADDEETIAKMHDVIIQACEIEKAILATRTGPENNENIKQRKVLQKQLYTLLKMGATIAPDDE